MFGKLKTGNKINIYGYKSSYLISGKVAYKSENYLYISFNSKIVSFNTLNYFSNLPQVRLDYINGNIGIPVCLLKQYKYSPSSNFSYQIKE